MPQARPESGSDSILATHRNYSMRDLVEYERVHPAIVRRLDDMCRVLEV